MWFNIRMDKEKDLELSLRLWGYMMAMLSDGVAFGDMPGKLAGEYGIGRKRAERERDLFMEAVFRG